MLCSKCWQYFCKVSSGLGHFGYADLSLSLHISEIVAKAHKHSAAIFRAFTSHSVEMLEEVSTRARAYLAYVRPVVEHDSIIWTSQTVKDIEFIETVQDRCTK